MARTLIYDIETTPNLGWVWQKWETDVIEFQQEWYLLCFAYKWLDESETHVVSLRQFRKDYKADPTDDRRVAEALHTLFDEADVVVAHNGDRFDQPKSNARFLVHGFGPPSPYKSVDTLKVARTHFAFNSNKLNDLGKQLGLGVKAETGGFQTWLGCMNGEKAAWDRMEKYNEQDVLLLEKLYLKLRPWMPRHPNIPAIEGKPDACTVCTSTNLQARGKTHTARTWRQRYRCVDCGHWCSGVKIEKTEATTV